MLVGTFIASVVFQSSMALTGAFPMILVLTVLAFIMLGDAVRDAIDPKLR